MEKKQTGYLPRFVPSMVLSVMAAYEILMYYVPEVRSILPVGGMAPQNAPVKPADWLLCISHFLYYH
jgi:hypothetical protein